MDLQLLQGGAQAFVMVCSWLFAHAHPIALAKLQTKATALGGFFQTQGGQTQFVLRSQCPQFFLCRMARSKQAKQALGLAMYHFSAADKVVRETSGFLAEPPRVQVLGTAQPLIEQGLAGFDQARL
jgi:hypothetical protein